MNKKTEIKFAFKVWSDAQKCWLYGIYPQPIEFYRDYKNVYQLWKLLHLVYGKHIKDDTLQQISVEQFYKEVVDEKYNR